jgi:hypothetical protein
MKLPSSINKVLTLVLGLTTSLLFVQNCSQSQLLQATKSSSVKIESTSDQKSLPQANNFINNTRI